MRHSLASLCTALALGGLGCQDNSNRPVVTPIPMTATSPSSPTTTADTIEYRATGNCGGAPVQIITDDDIDGTTVLPAVSLPYFATFQSKQATLFVLLEAQCNAVTTSGIVQVAVFINGTVFRDAYAQGAGALSATASGTWRRAQ